jgi:hypothetical protein
MLNAKSWSDRWEMPGHVYLARSGCMTVDGKDVWKLGAAYNGVAERMRTLNAKHGGLFMWEETFSLPHVQPARIEQLMTKRLKKLGLMVYRVDGIQMGVEVFATNDDTVGLRALGSAALFYRACQKMKEIDANLIRDNFEEANRLRLERLELMQKSKKFMEDGE